jgi:hypothetical protein
MEKCKVQLDIAQDTSDIRYLATVDRLVTVIKVIMEELKNITGSLVEIMDKKYDYSKI